MNNLKEKINTLIDSAEEGIIKDIGKDRLNLIIGRTVIQHIDSISKEDKVYNFIDEAIDEISNTKLDVHGKETLIDKTIRKENTLSSESSTHFSDEHQKNNSKEEIISIDLQKKQKNKKFQYILKVKKEKDELLYDIPLIHINRFFQGSISKNISSALEKNNIKANDIQKKSGSKLAKQIISQYFESNNLTQNKENIIAVGCLLFKSMGYGFLKPDKSDDSTFRIYNSFFALSDLSSRKKILHKSCSFSEGYIEAMLRIAFNKKENEIVQVKEISCLAQGSGNCKFKVSYGL